MSRCFSLADCLLDDHTAPHYAVQMNSIDEILRSTLKIKINSADFNQTYFLSKYWWKYLRARPGQAQTDRIACGLFVLCRLFMFPSWTQIANIEFEEADGGREDISVLV